MANEIQKMLTSSDFLKLAHSIRIIDRYFKTETAKAVNRNLTARNWLIGHYIFNYEQNGNDRAQYGTRMLQSLSKELDSPSLSHGNLKLYRQFYQEFNQLGTPILNYMSTNNDVLEVLPSQIGQTLLGQFNEEESKNNEAITNTIGQTPLGQLSPDTLFSRESDLEQAIMNHLQEYLLELGQGFCFESRQKRLLIDDEYFYCDLVFYHRILKCHVIIELKSNKFNYSDLAQLNMYVAYFKKNVMQQDDNPPVGILLCTEVGKEQVEYATAGMDQQLFVSKYLLQLPPKKELTQWLNKEIENYETK